MNYYVWRNAKKIYCQIETVFIYMIMSYLISYFLFIIFCRLNTSVFSCQKKLIFIEFYSSM